MPRKFGFGFGAGRRGRLPGAVAATAPAAMTVGQWGWTTAGSGQITVNLLTAPADGGSAITSYQYRIGAGAWTLLNAALGSWTIGGFTDGVATDLRVRAVNAIGPGPDSDAKSVTSQAGTLPSAFALKDWGVVNAGAGQATIGLQFLPALGTGSLIGVQWRVAGGAWVFLPGWSVGDYTVTGIVDGDWRTIELRAVTTVGNGAASDVKEVWTGVGVMPQIMYAGGKTLAGEGHYRPLDHNGVPQNLTGTVTNQVGMGSYVPAIATTGSITGVVFNSGGAGAPNGATMTVTTAAGPTVNLKVVTVPNTYHVASILLASNAYSHASCTLGDMIRLRAGTHNAALALQTFNRQGHTTPPGTWTQPGDLTTGNWIVLTRDPANPTTLGAIAIGTSNIYRRYARIHDMNFLSDQVGNSDGGTASISGQCSINSFFSGEAYVAVTDCRFTHTTTVSGDNPPPNTTTYTGPLQAIRGNGGRLWIEGNRILGCHTGIGVDMMNAPENIIRNNIVDSSQIDSGLIGTFTGLDFEGNISRNKLWPAYPKTVSAATVGATTTFTIPDNANFSIGELLVLHGFTGTFAALNGVTRQITGLTSNTVTIGLNTTGLNAADAAGGVVRCTAANHGDHWQFSDSNTPGTYQKNARIRGNVASRGNAGGLLMPCGQGFFAGSGVNTEDRTGWIVEGNVCDITPQGGIEISKLVGGVVRGNSALRQIGISGSSVNNQVTRIGISGSGNIVRDNLANSFSLGGSAVEDTNNIPVVITTPTDAMPATPGNIAAYEGHFVDPPTTANETHDAWASYAVRTTGGAQAGPNFAGYHFYDRARHVYSPLRAATAPQGFLAGFWSVADAITTGDAIITITDLPFNGDSPITALQVSVAGGAWVSLGGITPGSYPVAGFTDGLATNVNIRAVNAVGASATSDTKQVTTSAPSAPAAFAAGQWSVVDNVSSGQAAVTITALPAANGSAITALQYSVAGGAWTAFPAATIGTYVIGGFTDGLATNVNIRAVNGVGSGATSDTKQVTTSAPTGIVHIATGSTVEQASGTTLTVPLATNIAGDLLVLAISYDNGNNPTTPAGWTLSHTVVGFTANVPEIKVYTKISNGAEGANIAVTVPNRSHIGVTASFRLPNATPIGNVSSANTFSTTTRSSPSITSTANSIILHAYSWYPGGSLAFVATPPPSVTQMVSLRSTVKNGGMWLGWEKRVVGGATAARTLTLDVANGMAGGQVELRSA